MLRAVSCELCVLPIFVFCVVTGDIIPSSSDTVQKKVVKIGQSFELQCPLQARGFIVSWNKVDKSDPSKTTLLSSGFKLNIKNSRFALKNDPVFSTPSLHVKKAQVTDEGHYQCQVSFADDETTSLEIDVLIANQPIIFDNSTNSVVVTEGKYVKLECYAGGYPSPVVFWTRDYYHILPTESSQNHENFLTISTVTKEDRGLYVCVAQNEIGNTTLNVNVNVEFAPTVSVRTQELKQALGYGMDLECDITGYPAPTISWRKNGLIIKNNDHYAISSYPSRHLIQSNLRIFKAEKDHFGLYECHATNKFGNNQSFVKLTETKIPVCPPACEPPKSVASAGSTHSSNRNVLTGLFSLPVLYIFFN